VKIYRVGNSWGVTIVECESGEVPDAYGRAPSDRLMGTAQTPEDADRIVTALNYATEAEVL
jgi:hypothetical protein